ncbi:MAG: L-serine ammonia-lyase, iron-sulfur-dependent, subunit alpha [Brevinema sp.]
MYSLKELYRGGFGPSSSHTIGPYKAAKNFKEEHSQASSYHVTLYGSLAATGKGHFTDKAIALGFGDSSFEIEWKPEITLEQHPNGLSMQAKDSRGQVLAEQTLFSIGGGAVIALGASLAEGQHPYPHHTLSEILAYCHEHKLQIWEYVDKFEGSEIWDYLEEMRVIMMDCIQAGLDAGDEYLPVSIKLRRRASSMYAQALAEENLGMRESAFLTAYAHAVSEQNASMGMVVTAPTCGACGVLPAVLRYLQESHSLNNEKIRQALAVAGILGLLAKHNASISGAEAGCQAEIGVACSMAAGATAFLMGFSDNLIEYAAEVGMEHHLGLTCDPLGGFVLIPCIERNAVAAVRAVQSAYYVKLAGEKHLISYDAVLNTMKETGKDLREAYRETALGGLAKIFQEHPQNFC